ncbi:MAG: farnesyl diphosphate synthase [Acutalibacteraceae bacterium]|nr:polyprenyl synthetase family protein [Eubacteriales bacterium]MEE3311252.1 farnesyl diphosphate synthase [Acutalibacteraceae bacterium]
MNELNSLILESYSDLVDSRLEVLLEGQEKAVQDLTDAMRYSTMIGGKRIRPVLVLEFCRVCGGDPDHALDLACALEMIHTSSLIHDDMPCMDNDDMRRGQPSCHKKFGENTALLAGDALEAYAFEVAAGADLPAKAVVEAVKLLAKATGPYGMLGGQIMDVENESRDDVALDRLEATHQKKTGALIRVACELGCIAAGASKELRKAAVEYGKNLGLAFQVCDDILDVTGNELLLGKPVGSDEEEEKATYVTLLGLDAAKQTAKDYTDQAYQALEAFDENGFLRDLTESLLTREQ